MIKNWLKTAGRVLPDKSYIRLQFFYHLHRFPDLEHPKTFNEKLQWLKLHDRRPEYTMMVDKVLVKGYVAGLIGPEHIVPTLGVWDDPAEIDFEALPEQFVLKCNHDSGSIVICRDKSRFDRGAAVEELRRGLRRSGYWYGREWPYLNVEKKVFAEACLSENGEELTDYKIMCFNGRAKCCFVCTDRFSPEGLHITVYDPDWRIMPFERSHPAVREGLPRPEHYDDMLAYAEKLSRDLLFSRIDFYEVKGQVYFGEITFHPASGFEPFQPEEWDRRLGDWIDLGQ